MEEYLVVADLMADLNALGPNPADADIAAVADSWTTSWALGRPGDLAYGDFCRFVQRHPAAFPLDALKAVMSKAAFQDYLARHHARLHANHPHEGDPGQTHVPSLPPRRAS